MSNNWYDEAGRVVKSASPSSPATKTTYDGLGRTRFVYVGDPVGDPVPGSSGYDQDSGYNQHVFSNHQAVLTGDTILESAETRYAPDQAFAAGQAVFTKQTMRQHQAAAGDTLPLGSSPITMYSTVYYDKGGRPIASANYGTNTAGFQSGGAEPPVGGFSATPPVSSETVLVYGTTYDDRGRASFQSDPLGRVTRTFFDDLGRSIGVVENHQEIKGEFPALIWLPSASPPRWSVTGGLDIGQPDANRVTSFVYDQSGHTVLRVAHFPDAGGAEAIQATQYVYRVRTSQFNSNELLSAIHYPHESSGLPGSTPEYSQTFTYNTAGEVTATTDQNGTTHAYARDSGGRVTSDAATLGADVDSWADRVEYTYDAEAFRLSKVVTKSGSTAKNAVRFSYDSLWRPIRYEQAPTSDVPGSSQDLNAVAFEYMTSHSGGPSPKNTQRLSAIKYPLYPDVDPPNGGPSSPFRTTVSMNYLSTDDTALPGEGLALPDNAVSRPTGLTFDNGQVGGVVRMLHVGLSTPVIVRLPDGGIELQGFLDPSPNGASPNSQTGVYPAFDRFGRHKRQTWGRYHYDDVSSQFVEWNPDAVSPLSDHEYRYDAAANIVSRRDARQIGCAYGGPDNEFVNDGLNRLIENRRGKLTGSPPMVTSTMKGSQQWYLDVLGNWSIFAQDLNGNNSYFDAGEQQTRAHNFANEITEVSTPDPLAYTHDANGNLTMQQLSPISRRMFAYDAWNRLTRVTYQTFENGSWGGDKVRAVHTYNGFNHRTTTLADTNSDGQPDQKNHYFYDPSWRLFERRIQRNTAGGWNEPGFVGTAQRENQQFIWGLRHIDDLVAFFNDANGDAIFSDPEEGEDMYYALTDRNFSVIGLARRMPEDLSSEHDPWAMPIRYSAYGRAQAYPRADHDRNGTVEFADLSPAGILTFNRLWGDPNFNADVDLNNDGQTPNDECTTAVLGNWLATIPEGRISNPTTLGGGPLMDNIVGYDGYVFDDATELYCVRNRWYDPGIGRWLTRDPAGYVDGGNLYESVASRPIEAIDPSGLKDYRIGNGGKPAISWDAGFAYDATKQPTIGDHFNWGKYGLLLLAAETAGNLPDATRAYRHYREGNGSDLLIDYNKAVVDDKAIGDGLESELREAQSDIERLHDGKSTRFRVYSSSARLVNASTENWQKALGGHRIWGVGDVSYDPVSCEYSMKLLVKMEDFYNFNKGQVDIATGLPDNENGRFEVFGWAHSFYSRGIINREVKWKRGNIGHP